MGLLLLILSSRMLTILLNLISTYTNTLAMYTKLWQLHGVVLVLLGQLATYMRLIYF